MIIIGFIAAWLLGVLILVFAASAVGRSFDDGSWVGSIIFWPIAVPVLIIVFGASFLVSLAEDAGLAVNKGIKTFFGDKAVSEKLDLGALTKRVRMGNALTLAEELALITLARQRDALLEAAKGAIKNSYESGGLSTVEVYNDDMDALRAAIRSCEGE